MYNILVLLYLLIYNMSNTNKRFFYKNTKKSLQSSQKSSKFIITEEYKNIILNNSYLSPKGFTIPKLFIHKDDLNELKQELSLKKINNTPISNIEPEIVYAYRENEKKFYIPRFYAQKRYGNIINNKISNGDNINISFKGIMRDYQENIVNIFINHAKNNNNCSFNIFPIENKISSELLNNSGGGGLISLPCGMGKTIIAIKIAAELRKKTLIIVHKDFLLNQWVERIKDFCGENTTIGRIQGDIFDIEGKDFVIGMLQTLYSRSYPEEAFKSFGFLIIDETHRICSEQFSKALFKISPFYTLGISATIERKDGLNTLLNMFIGDIVYHTEREHDDPVCVRAIEYISNDEVFNKSEYDFRGNIQFSTMISKLCEFVPRANFIIKIIKDLLIENPEQQIMVLAHNKNLLIYIHDTIVSNNIATTGYYLGGMKEKFLKETEEKQIVIATYAMAAEALDIKTLSTLIMATPKKDITQSVGRILRMKHANPIIIDIVDSHDVFKNQWKIRRAYYKKCNYRIRYINSTIYNGMNFEWNNDNTWKKVFEPIFKNTDTDKDIENNEDKIIPSKCLINLEQIGNPNISTKI